MGVVIWPLIVALNSLRIKVLHENKCEHIVFFQAQLTPFKFALKHDNWA